MTWNGIISSNLYVVLNRNSHSNVNVLGIFYQHILTSLYRRLMSFWNQTRNKQKYVQVKQCNSLYFRNLSVTRSFLQYKSQCLKKVNVKYVINRLWHDIFHIVPGISPPASLSGLIWEFRADIRADIENVM